MMMIPQEISLLVSSDPSQGAINVSQDGSSFEIQLEEPIEVPKDAVNITTTVEEATIWWSVPNIITNQNDCLTVFGDREDGGAPQLFSIKIEQGLYNLTGLNNSIQTELEKVGAKVKDGVDNKPLIQLQADEATQKVLIRFNYTNAYIDFSGTTNIREILGFNQNQVGPFPSAPLNELAPNIASFNTVNYFLIASDLVQRGIRFNNRYNQIVSQVLINVSPGSQIISTPFNPAKITSNELAGTKRTNIRFRLTDDKLRPVDTAKEYYTARVVIRYMRPFILEKSN
jgi:hypothetical protein